MRLAMERVWLALGCIVTVVGAPAGAQEESVDQVLARHLEAKGGTAWEAVESLEITGRYSSYSLSHPFKLVRQRPNRYVFDRMENKRPVKTAFDGETAWWSNPYYDIGHPFRMTDVDARYLAHRSDFDCALIHPDERGISVELLGEQDLEGSPALVLETTRPDGAKQTWYLDPETYLERAVMGMTGAWGFEAHQEIFFDDYREVDGVVLPFYWENLAADNNTVVEIDAVKIDVEPEDDLFVLPPPEAMVALQAMIGDWGVLVEQKPGRPDAPWTESAGTATFTSEASGGLMVERFAYASPDGTPLTVVRQWSHDRFGDVYRITAHNDFSNQMKVMQGSMTEERLVLDTLETGTTDLGPGDSAVHRRMTVSGLGSDEFMVSIETSTDEGETWTPSQRYTYSR